LISDSTAPLVAALEQIVISEPEMAAGSSSNAGGDGLSLLSHCVPSYIAYAIDLESFALDVKKRKEILLGLCTVSILEVYHLHLLYACLHALFLAILIPHIPLAFSRARFRQGTGKRSCQTRSNPRLLGAERENPGRNG